jgi:nucleoside-diphosphate-sugar epimerase
MCASRVPRILVTGAIGQIGSELTPALRRKYGNANVVAAGHRTQPSPTLRDSGPFEHLDVTRRDTLSAIVDKYDINVIYHLAAILSAVGEKQPELAWDVNTNGLRNVLEVARERKMERLFWPSTMAVFGPDVPRENTPQDAVLRPRTLYGITKVAGELLCQYYFRRHGLDVRGARFPCVISSEKMPGGGSADYVVEIFYEALKHKHYCCPLREDSVLPVLNMPDLVQGTIELMEADSSQLKHRVDFNLAATSFSPADLAAEIRKRIPQFTCEYKPDWRQQIVDTWPRSLDTSAARQEWGWQAHYGLSEMVADMLEKLGTRHKEGRL